MRPDSGSSFPRDLCGHCLGPHDGPHARFCSACVLHHATADECGPFCPRATTLAPTSTEETNP